jgi:hypothetical protein
MKAGIIFYIVWCLFLKIEAQEEKAQVCLGKSCLTNPGYLLRLSGTAGVVRCHQKMARKSIIERERVRKRINYSKSNRKNKQIEISGFF